MTAYDSIVARLLTLHPKRIDLTLDRVQRLLAALGHPERQVPPVIHVAGTNGKGSTIAFMRAMLEAAGKRVHVYTSPHLVRFNERFRIAGMLVSDEALAAALEHLALRGTGDVRAQVVKLALTWGSSRLEQFAAGLIGSLTARLADENHADGERLTAARQLVQMRPGDGLVVEQVVAVLTPRASPALTAGLLESLTASRAPAMCRRSRISVIRTIL